MPGKEQIMDMTVNRLPARTWNWLKMNETVLSGVEPFRQQEIPEGNAFREENETEQSIFREIETGMGPDMDQLGENTTAAVIASEEGKTADAPVIVRLTPDGSFHRYFLHAKKGSVLKAAFLSTSEKEETRPFALQIKVYAEEGSRVELTMPQMLGMEVLDLTDIGGLLEKDASVELVKMELGAKKVYTGALMTLKGDGSSFTAHIGYQGFSGQHLDMNYVARHLGRKTGSLMESNGILSGNAFKLFRGSIDFVKGCAGSVGNEKEDVLLLGENVVNQTIPLILCAEEDVEGNHGASIGELDEKTLFYLMSRGFTKEAAETMIAGARLEAIAAKIPYSEIREQVEKYLEEQHEKL